MRKYVGVPEKASINPSAALTSDVAPPWEGIELEVSRTTVTVPPQRVGGADGSIIPPV